MGLSFPYSHLIDACTEARRLKRFVKDLLVIRQPKVLNYTSRLLIAILPYLVVLKSHHSNEECGRNGRTTDYHFLTPPFLPLSHSMWRYPAFNFWKEQGSAEAPREPGISLNQDALILSRVSHESGPFSSHLIRTMKNLGLFSSVVCHCSAVAMGPGGKSWDPS